MIVEKSKQVFPFFAVYDFECVLKKNVHKIASATKILTDHHPVSVSIHDNFSKKPPICHVNSDPDALLEMMLMSLRDSQKTSSSMMLEAYNGVLDKLTSYILICSMQVFIILFTKHIRCFFCLLLLLFFFCYISFYFFLFFF